MGKKSLIAFVTLVLFLGGMMQSVSPAHAAACLSFQSSMHIGSTDAGTNGEVTRLQVFLNNGGYLSSEPTGYFGTLTENAVKAFQVAQGVSSTGYVGQLTKAKLHNLSCGVSSTTSSGEVLGTYYDSSCYGTPPPSSPQTVNADFGTVWGSGPFTTDDSSLSAIAKFLGATGQATLSITDEGCVQNFISSTRNGITTRSWGSPWRGMSVVCTSGCDERGVGVPTGSFTSLSDCTIPSGASSCTTNVGWSVTSPVTPRVLQNNVQFAEVAQGTQNRTLQYGTNTFTLKDGTATLDTKTANAACASNTTWDGARCVAVVSLGCAFSASKTSINAGESSLLTWTTTGASSAWMSQLIGRVPVNGSQTVSPSVTTKYIITAIGSDGSGKSCETTVTVVPPSVPTGSFTSLSDCTIPSGASSCTTNVGWSVTSPVTPRVLQNNVQFAEVAQGTQNRTLQYGTNTFTLKDGTATLDTKTANATCASNTTWDGARCATVVPNLPTASLTISSDSVNYGKDVTIVPGASVTYRWSSTNGIGWVTYTSVSGTCTDNGYNGIFSYINSAMGELIRTPNGLPGCTYTLTYTVSGNSGTLATDSVNIHVVAPTPTRPAPPTISQTCSADGTSVTFTFSSAGAIDYFLRFDTDTTYPHLNAIDHYSQTNWLKTGITPNTQYYFWVHAGNGGANWSTDISDATVVGVKCPPSTSNDIVLLPETIRNLTAANATTKEDYINLIKYKACAFDSIVQNTSQNGLVEDQDEYYELLKRSQCEVLRRSIETWTTQPRWDVIQSNMNLIAQKTNNRKFVYSMFIAEAINRNDSLTYINDNGDQVTLNFSDMCRSWGVDMWGQGTCVPSVENEAYRNYLRYIIKKGIDVGIQDFLFGQTDYQDPNHQNRQIPGIVNEMRAYAQSKGKIVLFGQQPNSYDDETYLRSFDYIDGPVCIESSGSGCNPKIEDMHDRANAVITEFDWSSTNDDIHIWGRKTAPDRKTWLLNKLQYLYPLGVGFSVPFREPLNGGAVGSCYGINQWVYSPDNKYGCKDEDFLNQFLSGIVHPQGVGLSFAPKSSVLGTQTHRFTQTLSLGAQGTEVTELQKALKAKGFYTDFLSGNFDKTTEIAVMNFQGAFGLPAVGIVGPQTRALLNQ